MNDKHYIACDLGAESGRVILGTLADGTLRLEEVHRFPNLPVNIQGSMRWNIVGIFQELKAGLRKVADRQLPIDGLSVDSWGVDYVLFNDETPMLSLPHHYRDSRTDSTYVNVLEQVGREAIFAETGIQFMSINTLYQLVAEVERNPKLMACAEQFLNIAEYFHYLFCGVARAEASMASTTQIYNPVTRNWSAELIRQLQLPESLFPKIVPSGTRLGPLTPEICAETGLSEIDVIATCAHDTGAAVAAVPAEGDDWAYLSSGTWSLIGVELPAPLLTDAARAHNFTNEVGFGGTSRFLKNIIGLWLLQESRRAWAREGLELDYDEITRLAAEAEAFRSLIDPNDPRFLKPESMPAKIAAYCHETAQPAPETPGQFARCILESLALLYGQSLQTIQELTERTITKLHVVGGGSQSKLLNQFAANATGRSVLAGPVEATAIGNVLLQAIALGELDSLVQLRSVVRTSFPIETYEPQAPGAWHQAADRFAKLELKR